jgi:hypothetical protein
MKLEFFLKVARRNMNQPKTNQISNNRPPAKIFTNSQKQEIARIARNQLTLEKEREQGGLIRELTIAYE